MGKVIEFKKTSGLIQGYAIQFDSSEPRILGFNGTLHGDTVIADGPNGTQVQFILGVTFFSTRVEAADAIEKEIKVAIAGYGQMLKSFQEKRRIQKV